MQQREQYLKDAILNGTVRNTIVVKLSGDNSNPEPLYNNKIISDSLKLHQALCDNQNLKFGGCIASELNLEVISEEDLAGKTITLSIVQTAIIPTFPGTNTYPVESSGSVHIKTFPGSTTITDAERVLFVGKIYSSKLSKKRIVRKIIAYDNMYWIGNMKCTNWYHKLYEGKDWLTIGELRESLFQKVGFTNSQSLPADNFKAYMMDGTVTVADILRQICEINGCFGFLADQSTVKFVFINQGNQPEQYSHYIDLDIEDYAAQGFNGFQIRFDNGETGIYSWNSNNEPENLYLMDDNRLVTAGYRPETLNTQGVDGFHFESQNNPVKENFNISYTPIRLRAEYRNWVELGDKIIVNIKWFDLQETEHNDTVESIVLSRTISGTGFFTDEIIADGENTHFTDVSSSEE